MSGLEIIDINMPDESFPGLGDLKEHLEPMRLDDELVGCNVPMSIIKPPPGLGFRDKSKSRPEPKWVLPGSARATQDATHVKDPEKVVSTLLDVERRLLQDTDASEASVEGAMLAALVSKAIANLGETAMETPAAKRGSCDPVPLEKLPETVAPLGAAAPPPGLRSALRSSAKPFMPVFSPQQTWLTQPTAPKSAVSLEAGLPMRMPGLPAADSLRAPLLEAHAKDPGRILVVRKIHRLGKQLAEKLRSHFDWYGPVEGVLAPPSHGLCQGPQGVSFRLRPAFMGYVIMATAQGAEAALAEGMLQSVAGVEVEVLKFEPDQHHLVPDDEAHSQ